VASGNYFGKSGSSGIVYLIKGESGSGSDDMATVMTNDEERAREEAAGWLILLDDDPSDEDRRAEFRAWLRAPLNAAAWESVSRTGALLAAAGETGGTKAADGPERSVAPVVASRSRWSGGRRATAMMAALLLVCAAALGGPSLLRDLQADHVTRTAQVRSIQLEDGSSVRLGPDTALRVDLAGTERRVTILSGEALFDVAPDAGRPFRVTTRDSVTTVLGTRFDVALLSEGTTVGVSHGRVQVAAVHGGSAFELGAGDWLNVATDGAVERASNLPDHLLGGPEARLAVRNRPVSEVVDRLRPWFAGRIVIADGSVGRAAVTGVFDTADPEAALRAIVGPQGGRVLRVSPWLLIVSKG
jgi:transmembrane sensor